MRFPTPLKQRANSNVLHSHLARKSQHAFLKDRRRLGDNVDVAKPAKGIDYVASTVGRSGLQHGDAEYRDAMLHVPRIVAQMNGESMICPRCDGQGELVIARINATGEVVRLCDECDALWPGSGPLDGTAFIDFSTYVAQWGLLGRWNEITILESSIPVNGEEGRPKLDPEE